MTDLLSLADECEKAAGARYELECRIAAAVGRPKSLAVPNYTASIDAALTLVPEKWSGDIWLKRYNGHHWQCELHVPSYAADGRNKDPALAICAAALRARAAGHGEG